MKTFKTLGGFLLLTISLICGMIWLSDYQKLPDCPATLSFASDRQTRATKISCSFQAKCTKLVTEQTTICQSP